MTAISRDEWLKALNEAGLPTESDEEALTASEYAELMGGIPRSTANGHLDRLVRAGKAIRTWKRQIRSDGDTIMSPAFRLVR